MGSAHSTQHTHIHETSLGKLKGIEARDSSGKPIYHRYAKVPYALPPVGSRRWRHPQPLPVDFSFSDSNGQPGDYTAFGPICPQPVYGHSAAVLANPDAIPKIQNEQSEDCLYLNIFVPAGKPPPGGWAVQFYIHGGWLQVGHAMQGHDLDPIDLLRESTPRIICSPTYRLNLFGFLGGSELASLKEDPSPSNFGLWDQRAALEFVHRHIAHFGGNPSNISCGGLSAGANSTFFQLYHDIHLPPSQRIIKRVYLWSNAVAIQPASTTSTQLTTQFNELCTVNSISPTLPIREKLSRLRAIPAADLNASITRLKQHTFRSSTDDAFIPSTFLHSLHSGHFTTLLAKHNISVLLGECAHEAELYKLVNPPSDYPGLLVQLANYYPKPVYEAMLPHFNVPPKDSKDVAAWQDVFAQMTGAGQVHIPERGLTHLLLHPPSSPGVAALPPQNLHRYRIEWRAKGMDAWVQPQLGVCHGADTPIWWCSGWRAGYDETDRRNVLEFIRPFGEFLEGRDVAWGSKKGDQERRIRVFGKDGRTMEDVEDGNWERWMPVWESIWESQRQEVARL
ncbi:putative esterase/lipase [Cyphellophora attinorum]|uniref:Putative esterase/lipase n=1 Tax=Cyphellophora attinorum TaxID=1664694 RepID=A0A0N0NJB2_9EURO|nr:putative esterase/lipase [Phialophora attinorum]KPI36781.1 putative esterase/lipase [Phialophora attinorum]